MQTEHGGGPENDSTAEQKTGGVEGVERLVTGELETDASAQPAELEDLEDAEAFQGRLFVVVKSGQSPDTVVLGDYHELSKPGELILSISTEVRTKHELLLMIETLASAVRRADYPPVLAAADDDDDHHDGDGE